jgi:hypothetical protein
MPFVSYAESDKMIKFKINHKAMPKAVRYPLIGKLRGDKFFHFVRNLWVPYLSDGAMAGFPHPVLTKGRGDMFVVRFARGRTL